MSLVIDDLGYSLDQGKAAIELEGDHTYAMLPGATLRRKLARARASAQQGSHPAPAHAIDRLGIGKREPHALNEAMDEDQLTGKVHSLLNANPVIRGVNNHMGSHLTEFDFFMRPVMDSIRSLQCPNLYFLDSRTSPRSVAMPRRWMPDCHRFRATSSSTMKPIPNRFACSSISGSKARERGSAIAIGHPYSANAESIAR